MDLPGMKNMRVWLSNYSLKWIPRGEDEGITDPRVTEQSNEEQSWTTLHESSAGELVEKLLVKTYDVKSKKE